MAKTKDEIQRQILTLTEELSKLQEAKENSSDEFRAAVKNELSKEIKAIKKLSIFQHDFTVTSVIKVQVDAKVGFCSKNADGWVWVESVKQNGYNIEPFFGEDCLGNVDMDSLKDFKTISPEIAAQVAELKNATKDFITKVKPIAKKFGIEAIDIEVDLEELFDD
jgi:hypothetical protein